MLEFEESVSCSPLASCVFLPDVKGAELEDRSIAGTFEQILELLSCLLLLAESSLPNVLLLFWW